MPSHKMQRLEIFLAKCINNRALEKKTPRNAALKEYDE